MRTEVSAFSSAWIRAANESSPLGSTAMRDTSAEWASNNPLSPISSKGLPINSPAGPNGVPCIDETGTLLKGGVSPSPAFFPLDRVDAQEIRMA
jgi:hypothetical protein